jgi:NADPH:quinone reductase-like Zn-dependent oxidoreductase
VKAIVYTQYGSPEVLKVADAATPTPKDDQILVRVHAASVGFGDLMARNFRAVTPRQFSMPYPLWLLSKLNFGTRVPKITVLGSEFSGVVAAVGNDVRRFKPGEAVFGFPGQSFGAYAEYLVMSEKGPVAHKPSNMTFEEAAAAPYGAIMAVNLLRKANVQPGQKVLVVGA